jgi:hypothetical protein
MNAMTNQETDTALILENELQRRIKQVLAGVVHEVVNQVIEKRFAVQKEAMLMEVSLSIGKMMRVIEEEGRKPLWEATPEEFGLTHEELNRSSIRRLDDVQNLNNAIEKELNHAIRKQT